MGDRGRLPRRAARLGAGRRAAGARRAPVRGDEAAARQRRPLRARLPRPAGRLRDVAEATADERARRLPAPCSRRSWRRRSATCPGSTWAATAPSCSSASPTRAWPTGSSRSPPAAPASCRCGCSRRRGSCSPPAREPAGICLAVAAWLRWLASQPERRRAARRGRPRGRRQPPAPPRPPSERSRSARCSATTCRESAPFRELLTDALARLDARRPARRRRRRHRRAVSRASLQPQADKLDARPSVARGRVRCRPGAPANCGWVRRQGCRRGRLSQGCGENASLRCISRQTPVKPPATRAHHGRGDRPPLPSRSSPGRPDRRGRRVGRRRGARAEPRPRRGAAGRRDGRRRGAARRAAPTPPGAGWRRAPADSARRRGDDPRAERQRVRRS